ncbi:SanA/YdcF family protein [Gordonia soli]|uniref:DUF218 domain-containing protein n=1 Tax=Gordonia soli NBRC 108243 TaxID=1223545 RepID=M0QFY1_9ACTN|nr:ElyC/SanA/YdcF family protein [Gordonia soli]GAC67478.1 hypothetical protein GS4_08_00620 [Gordonia soli NBRC 108243]
MNPRRRRTSRHRGIGLPGRLLLGVIVVVELIVTVAATWVYVESVGREFEVADVTATSPADFPDTALVLGALVTDGRPGDYVRGRLDTVEQLYRTGRITRIINSGNGSAGDLGEPSVMRSVLEADGVPARAIVDDDEGFDTALSCRRARDEFGARRVVIVTQDFHLARAIALCRDVGVDAVGVSAECECPTLTYLRNHVREALLARPRALLTALTGI